MKYINLGINNEYDFIKVINKLKFKNMDFNIQEFLLDIYDNKIYQNDLFYSWKNLSNQKTDIYIRKNSDKDYKCISIKMGSNNSIHTEKLDTFIKFLKKNKINDYYIKILIKYHYKDNSMDGSGKIRFPAKEYKNLHYDNICILNDKFRNEDLLFNLIKRFILIGKNDNDVVDVVVHGTPNNFLYIKSKDLYKMLKIHMNDINNSVHFSFFVYQNKNANLNFNPRFERDRKYIQIKWYNIVDIIIENMNNMINSNN